MKFGKAFIQQLPRGAAWHHHALAYKSLKRLVKQCAGLSHHHKLCADTLAQCRVRADQTPRTDAALQASPIETAFFSALRDEIYKVNRFFLHEQRLCGTRLARLEYDIQHATRAIARHRFVSGYGRHEQWLYRAGQLYRELVALEGFCVLNVCAVSKILKKHDKWTAYNTRARFEHAVLVKQPFATYAPLLQMLRRVETIACGVSLVALTEQPTRFSLRSPMLLLAGLASVERKQVSEFELPPLRIVKEVIEDDATVTDCEDLTPRAPVEAFDYIGVNRERDGQRPR